jgi:hypothetical protein
MFACFPAARGTISAPMTAYQRQTRRVGGKIGVPAQKTPGWHHNSRNRVAARQNGKKICSPDVDRAVLHAKSSEQRQNPWDGTKKICSDDLLARTKPISIGR